MRDNVSIFLKLLNAVNVVIRCVQFTITCSVRIVIGLLCVSYTAIVP